MIRYIDPDDETLYTDIDTGPVNVAITCGADDGTDDAPYRISVLDREQVTALVGQLQAWLVRTVEVPARG